jgi:hypothetical protein
MRGFFAGADVGLASGAAGSRSAESSNEMGRAASFLRIGRATAVGSYTDCHWGDAAFSGDANITELMEKVLNFSAVALNRSEFQKEPNHLRLNSATVM